MSTLYKVLERLIENGRTDGMSTKLDVFYAAGKLTEDEYNKLTEKLNGKADTDEKLG
jgi:uncharacterized membrane protein